MDEEFYRWQQLQLENLNTQCRKVGLVVKFPDFKVGWTNLALIASRDIKNVQKGLFSAYFNDVEWKAVCTVYRYRRCAPTEYCFSVGEQRWVQISQ